MPNWEPVVCAGIFAGAGIGAGEADRTAAEAGGESSPKRSLKVSERGGAAGAADFFLIAGGMRDSGKV